MLEAIHRKLAEEKKSSIEEVKRQKAKEDSRKQADSARSKRPREKGPATRKQGVEGVANERTTPLPDKAEGEGSRRRGRRRGKGQEGLETVREELGEKREVTAQANSSGAPTKRRRGKRRKGAPDAKEVQESVRRTLSQLNEGRVRRRYERGPRERRCRGRR